MNTTFGEIRSNYIDDKGICYIDGWHSIDDDEEGVVIATINPKTFEVNYRDEAYKTDDYVLEVIKEKLKEIVN